MVAMRGIGFDVGVGRRRQDVHDGRGVLQKKRRQDAQPQQQTGAGRDVECHDVDGRHSGGQRLDRGVHAAALFDDDDAEG
jgi:hypothetical protein